MSIATEINRIQQAKTDIKNSINSYTGLESITSETLDEYSNKINTFGYPMFLEVGATTVRTSSTTTENIASNDHIKIYGNNDNAYTIAEWNQMFVDAGYDKNNMSVEPIGIQCDYLPNKEVYLFDRYTGVIYNTVGDSEATAGYLQHSIYNYSLVSSSSSGTDYVSGKTWRVTSSGNNWILDEDNTKQSWTIPKNTGAANSFTSFNIVDRTYSIWAQTEWMRHRMAISSGISTNKENGSYGEIQILSSNGIQADINEDMYFWIKNDSDILVNTNILAKYNRNNRHTVNSNSLTNTIRDAIYTRQITNGINMNDTGINSSSKPILVPGSKGAEVIAVDGEWKIITPYISQPSSTVSTATYNMSDSPAIYWAIYKGFSLPSDTLLFDMSRNKTIYDAIINYLKTKEGRTDILAIPTGTFVHSSIRSSSTGAIDVYIRNKYVYGVNTNNRYFTVLSKPSI